MSQPAELVAMVGTRRRIPAVLASITTTLEGMDRETIVVTGAAPGTALHVKRECKRLGFRFIECHARWDHKGPAAGPERNTIIARLAQRVYAWPASPNDTPENRKLSAGTWNCVEQFASRGKTTVVMDDAWRTG